MNYLQIAQRNLWRNKRRTIITIASILFAVFFAVIMRSFQLGSYTLMIKNGIESYSGYIRLQHPDYSDDPLLENTIPYNDSINTILSSFPNVKSVSTRLETFALASSGNITKGVLVLGIDPEAEQRFSNPQKFLVRYYISDKALAVIEGNSEIPQEVKAKLKDLKGEGFIDSAKLHTALELLPEQNRYFDQICNTFQFAGQFLNPSDSDAVISFRLFKYLNLNVGDSLILLSQGYQGSSAAGIYRVKGVVKLSNPELDNKVVYMPLGKAQEFTGVENRIAYWAINLHNNDDEAMLQTQSELKEHFGESEFEIKNWKELNRILVQQINSDNQSGKAFLVLLYFVVFFGIFGTVIMMIHERIHEFGVLVSVGMQKAKLATLVVMEMIFMAIIGVVIGTGLSLPIIYYYHFNPIRLTGEMAKMMMDMGYEPLMPMEPFGAYVVWQGVVVLVMVIIACIYPARRIFKLKEVEALRR